MLSTSSFLSIEGNPFITRFKTNLNIVYTLIFESIEGNPFITRFKTSKYFLKVPCVTVLKVIHL